MNKWLKCICQVCGMKNGEEGVEAYCRDGDEHNDNEHEGVSEGMPVVPPHLESNESSPTLSTSSPYIPISECITGKPIISNEPSSAGPDSRYCNTTFFPFPPRVNWATHPITTRESESSPSPSKVGPIAPPRPPKKKSSPTFAGNPVSPFAISSGTSMENMRNLPTPSSSASRTVFRYDKFDEEYEEELKVTYLQIDTMLSTKNSHSPAATGDGKPFVNLKGTLKSMKDRDGILQLPETSGVEYKMIDHVKTKALNQMIQDREEQLSRPTNPTSKTQNH